MSDAELSSAELSEWTSYQNAGDSSSQLSQSDVNARVTGSAQGQKDIRKLVRAILAGLKLIGIGMGGGPGG